MGCFGSKETKSSKSAAPETFSWDNKPKLDPKDFLCSKRNGETFVKLPGSINGQQFIIEECDNCDIYLLDYSDSVQIDYCTNSRIFIGPSQGSLFLRNCTNCKVVIACQQFRTRECESIDVLLYSMTQPIIESSKNMTFSCFQYNYPELLDQFSRANLSVFVNDWSNIYDFNPAQGNWRISDRSKPEDFADFLKPVERPDASTPAAPTLPSAVPLTWGTRPKPYGKGRFLLFHKKRVQSEQVLDFLELLRLSGAVVVVQTRERTLDQRAAGDAFSSTPELAAAVVGGPVIGVELNGDDFGPLDTLVQQWAAKHALQDVASAVYVSPDERIAAQYAHAFFVAAKI
eukprot:TRINITY_DN12269_c0_g1_i1.p1 TRINITY_DN12269_c0_g1~~TRINITY_DN12269_c0_g1_i1.p1  ORF type:complete len:367 (-),score=80.66 TRINITY_DN12269_c0_g1_i1:207-1238(-)